MQAHWRQILFLTLGAVGVFIFSQTFPRAVAPERPADLLAQLRGGELPPDFCEVSESGYGEVREDRSPVRLTLQPPEEIRPGESAEWIIRLTLPDGRPVRWDDILPTHGEKIHLLAIGPDLSHYVHLHPRATDQPGEYAFPFTPRTGGNYRIFVEWMARATGRNVRVRADVTVPGASPSALFRPASDQREQEGLHFRLSGTDDLRAGKPAVITLHLHRPDGGEVTLQPFMESYAHLVAFDQGRNGFAHFHPIREGLDWTPSLHNPEMDFVFFTNRAGPYILWAQVKIDGREHYFPFSLEVAPRSRRG